ncbi:hypothetical protein HYH03_015423 [Edaphochlamys debaryana]|uniref:Aminotransferase class V domain-containing protein n=1 Tax=Edaphochlamys debaryana TaxID=47281 RepID=A0A835XRX2_9CHLO|nr:hypothetical protein HYH03_015423 [Edaphochlamys debaryana]|eukprot:KAG2485840.1 hypothetical protein HYH03_015423 [Edaphochlamys debaryana]
MPAPPLAGASLPYERVREEFDYFKQPGELAFMENAGGSQVPRCVVDGGAEYFRTHYAQLGAGYARSQRATQVVADSHALCEVLMNSRGVGKVAIGPSTSQLVFNLATMWEGVLGPGDNIVLHEASHEAAIGPWVRLAQRSGAEVRWWRADPATGATPMSGLEAALDASTRIVVVAHVSNLIGEVLDLAAAVQGVRRRAPGAQVLADGVAFAPHRTMDVATWGVDWYVWSCYKVYGPHMAVLYGSHSAFEHVAAVGAPGPNHYFTPQGDLPYRLELGGAPHEGCAGLLALQDYLSLLAQLSAQTGHARTAPLGAPSDHTTPAPASTSEASPGAPSTSASETTTTAATTSTAAAAAATAAASSSGSGSASPLLQGVRLSRSDVEAAFALMTDMEAPLQARLLSYLAAHPAVRLLGSADPDPGHRVPTISFVHTELSSPEVVTLLQAAGFAVRYGHMYGRRLVEALASSPDGFLAGAVGRHLGSANDPGAGPGTANGSGLSWAEGAQEGAVGEARRRAEDEGVVRVSLLHYNTPEEVEALVGALERLL